MDEDHARGRLNDKAIEVQPLPSSFHHEWRHPRGGAGDDSHDFRRSSPPVGCPRCRGIPENHSGPCRCLPRSGRLLGDDGRPVMTVRLLRIPRPSAPRILTRARPGCVRYWGSSERGGVAGRRSRSSVPVGAFAAHADLDWGDLFMPGSAFWLCRGARLGVDRSSSATPLLASALLVLAAVMGAVRPPRTGPPPSSCLSLLAGYAARPPRPRPHLRRPAPRAGGSLRNAGGRHTGHSGC